MENNQKNHRFEYSYFSAKHGTGKDRPGNIKALGRTPEIGKSTKHL